MHKGRHNSEQAVSYFYTNFAFKKQIEQCSVKILLENILSAALISNKLFKEIK